MKSYSIDKWRSLEVPIMIPFFLRDSYLLVRDTWTWRNNNTNCTDAKKLFEAIVFKPEDVIKKVDIGYWSASKSQSYNYLQSKDQWHQYDSSLYGRCFTFKPSPEQITKGIHLITLKLGVESIVFTHTPGMFLTQPENKMTFNGGEVTEHQKAEVKKIYFWELNHEHHNLLCNEFFPSLKV